MTERKIRIGRCHRCVYSWRMRRRYPRICPRCKSKHWRTPKLRPVSLGAGLGIEELLLPVRPQILALGRAHGATGFRVFGSVRRREATETSDVDLLVRLTKVASWLDFASLHADLETLLDRKVDLIEEGQLPWAIRPQIESEAVPL
jgi:predicted nucleotidyltransferase